MALITFEDIFDDTLGLSKWAKRWLTMAVTVSGWSEDTSTNVGAVIVDARQVVRSFGWNGLPRGTNNTAARNERPLKYKWFEHAERNAIYNAASAGVSVEGCTIYITMFPCCDCARAIIQSGIKEIVVPYPDIDHERWGDDFRESLLMFEESGVAVIFSTKQAT